MLIDGLTLLLIDSGALLAINSRALRLIDRLTLTLIDGVALLAVHSLTLLLVDGVADVIALRLVEALALLGRRPDEGATLFRQCEWMRHCLNCHKAAYEHNHLKK